MALDRGDVQFKQKNLELDMKNGEPSPPKPSIEEVPKVELQALLPHLRYVFMVKSDHLLVIIASDLNVQQV